MPRDSKRDNYETSGLERVLDRFGNDRETLTAMIAHADRLIAQQDSRRRIQKYRTRH